MRSFIYTLMAIFLANIPTNAIIIKVNPRDLVRDKDYAAVMEYRKIDKERDMAIDDYIKDIETLRSKKMTSDEKLKLSIKIDNEETYIDGLSNQLEQLDLLLKQITYWPDDL